MKKVISFSLFLMLGLVASQLLPPQLGDRYLDFKEYFANPLLYVCLSFIMINVGREFEIDKSQWRSYTADYFIAMATAALPWLLIALYFVFVLLPQSMWGEGGAWRDSLLLSRFAAPTSAGILFTMLAAMNLSKSWIYKKIQVLAIFDDLDTILLMIPLQMMMVGVKWEMAVILIVVIMLLTFGWRRLGSYDMPQNWRAIIFYAVLIFAITHSIYLFTKHYLDDSTIHIEVLLPSFVLGMVMKSRHTENITEARVASIISYLFMFLVGLSMPLIIGDSHNFSINPESMITTVPRMSWGVIALHVLVVSALSNIGKLMPLFFYRDRRLSERLAVSIGMFTRGEVGAGVIFIAISYNLNSNALIISALTLVLNLILTGGFVLLVQRLALRSQRV